MERCIDIRLRLHYEPRALRPLLAGLFVVLLASDLASENVTLTTYYPAPSGVYTQLITTGNTYAARDAGTLAVGTKTPNAAYKMDVAGNALLESGYYLAFGNQSWIDSDQGGAIELGANNGNANALGATPYIDFHYGIGAAQDFNVRLINNSNGLLSLVGDGYVSGAQQVVGNFNVGAAGPGATGHGYVYIDNTNTGCAATSIAGDVFNTACPAGQYITAQPGFYIESWSYFNRGGQVLAQTIAGNTSTQVWGLDNCSGGGSGCSGNPTWMTLKKDDSVMQLYCCPK
jgi:hypothetical protein